MESDDKEIILELFQKSYFLFYIETLQFFPTVKTRLLKNGIYVTFIIT